MKALTKISAQISLSAGSIKFEKANVWPLLAIILSSLAIARFDSDFNWGGLDYAYRPWVAIGMIAISGAVLHLKQSSFKWSILGSIGITCGVIALTDSSYSWLMVNNYYYEALAGFESGIVGCMLALTPFFFAQKWQDREKWDLFASAVLLVVVFLIYPAIYNVFSFEAWALENSTLQGVHFFVNGMIVAVLFDLMENKKSFTVVKLLGFFALMLVLNAIYGAVWGSFFMEQ